MHRRYKVMNAYDTSALGPTETNQLVSYGTSAGCAIQRYYYTKVLLSKVLFIQRYY